KKAGTSSDFAAGIGSSQRSDVDETGGNRLPEECSWQKCRSAKEKEQIDRLS
nr:hypothetical protein [Tanacetum cinerariifolium]